MLIGSNKGDQSAAQFCLGLKNFMEHGTSGAKLGKSQANQDDGSPYSRSANQTI